MGTALLSEIETVDVEAITPLGSIGDEARRPVG
jgi:hypothetical protein